MVQSIVLYNSETWIIKEDQKRKLKTFEMAVLRKICGITRRDRRRNVDIEGTPCRWRRISMTYYRHAV